MTPTTIVVHGLYFTQGATVSLDGSSAWSLFSRQELG